MELFQLAVEVFRNERVTCHADTQTCVELMKEFLRCQALWASQLALREELPFPDLARSVEPTVDYPHELTGIVNAFVRSMAEYKCCENLLRWYTLLKKQDSIARRFLLPDPFLPVIRFFQRGSCFTREHRYFIEINGGIALDSRTIQAGELGSPFAEVDQNA